MTTAERIRVLIAGNVYTKRALVRRFLEDDGYQVVDEPLTAPEVLPAVAVGHPDAVVLDEDLIGQGATIEAIRATQPDARVVVFGAAPMSEASVSGADGYLEKGVGLAALTALLGRLFAGPALERTTESESTLVGAAAAAIATEATVDQSGASGAGRGGGAGFRAAAIAIGALLIPWGVFAAIGANDTGGEQTTQAEGEPAAVDTGGPVVEEETTQLDQAYATLDELVVSLEDGNYVLAIVDAQTLMDQREQALDAGFAVVSLDAEVTARLTPIAGELPPRVSEQMAAILGDLYPTVETEEPGGGGSDFVLAESATNPESTGGGTGGGDTTTGDGGGGGGGDTTTGDGGAGGGGDTTTGDGGGGGSGETLGPGDGRAWGQSHKPPEGGWHGEKPHPNVPGLAFGHEK